MNYKTDFLIQTIEHLIDARLGPSDQKIKRCFLEVCKHIGRMEREIAQLKERTDPEK